MPAKKTRRPGATPTTRADRYPGAQPIEQAGDWTEWAEHDQEVVGTFMGLERFRNGWKADMDTENGPVVFSTPSLLLGLLKRVEIGTAIAIVYTGDRPGPAGKNAIKEFEVYALPT